MAKVKIRATKRGSWFSRLRPVSFAKSLSRAQLLVFVLIFVLIGGLGVYLSLAGSLTENDELSVYNQVNTYRQQQGVAPLGRSGCMTSAAREWAQHMAAYNHLHHSNGWDGSTYFHTTDPGLDKLILKYCPDQWSYQLAENVGVGVTSGNIFNAFINSTAHRTNIVNGNYNLTGVGAYRDDSGVLWVAQMFTQCKGCSSAWTSPPASPNQTPIPTQSGIVGTAQRKDGSGYWTVDAYGRVAAFGTATKMGDLTGKTLNKPIVGMAAKPDGSGYWLVASDGGIFAFGSAQFYGSTGGWALNKPIVGMAVTPSGGGYWLVASDGGIFAFGNAGFYGSTGSITLNKPIIGMAPASNGAGYWLFAGDGGIFAFGSAQFYGSTGGITLNKPIVGMTAAPNGAGYWLVASDGGIFTFGNVGFYGSAGGLGLTQPVVGMLPAPDSAGYMIIQADGTALRYGSMVKPLGYVVPYVNTAPSVPANLHAVSSTTSSISLAWNASTDNRGVQGYNIYRNGTKIAAVNGLSYTDSGLQSSKTYSYQISAYDYEGGVSALSPALATATQNAPPSVPQNLHTTSEGYSAIAFAWNASTDDTGVQGYDIYRNGTKIATVSASQLAYTDSNLIKDTTYSYQIRALDLAGAASGLSPAVGATTCATPACNK